MTKAISLAVGGGAGDEGLVLPSGTTSQRNPVEGAFWYNTEGGTPEYYRASVGWTGLAAKDGTTQARAALKSTDIKLYNPGAPTGWYWVQLDGVATQVYVDMNYDGGGWVLVGSHPINVGIPALTYDQTTIGFTQLGSSGFVVGSGDPKAFASLMPLARWRSVVNSNSAGNNFVYFTAGSQVELGNTGAHNRRSRWRWTSWGSNYSWQGLNSLSNEVGGVTPGLYTYHAANAYAWSALNNNPSGCANQYSWAPLWYGACWDGSFWGGNGAGNYPNAAFWTGSSSDYYTYGAWYVK
jgi:hypothetical protein